MNIVRTHRQATLGVAERNRDRRGRPIQTPGSCVVMTASEDKTATGRKNKGQK